MEQLAGKVCVVTGGASGIGLALATRFRAAGMRVAIADVEAEQSAAAVAELGDDVLAVACDVSSRASVLSCRDAVLDRFGAVHLVCLNAGVLASGPLLETPDESWRWMLDVNVMGVVHGIQAFGPGLVAQGEGHVVCTSSVAGLVSPRALGGYSATKHAVLGIAAVLRDEVAPAGVGVSVVCPGIIRTRIYESERNRPTAMGGPTHLDQDMAGRYQRAADRAAGPEVVADAVHDAVLANRLFVFPNPEVADLVRARSDEVLASLPAG